MDNSLNDSQVIELIKNGQHEYYRELVQRHEQKIQVFIFYMLKSNSLESIAEDLCQETFIKAYKNLDKFRDEEATFSTWLYTIARNTVLSELRKHKNKEAVYLEDTHLIPRTDKKDIPEHELLRNEQINMVREAIQSLPENQKTALLLREYEQLDYSEISRVMDCSVSAVKSLIFRGRSSVKVKLEPYMKNTNA